jgi:L-serine dehydratase
MGKSSIYTSYHDIFRIGVGPSSSHTIGPIRIGNKFINSLDHLGFLQKTVNIKCELMGSLAATGIGHGTPNAVIAGLLGYLPDNYDISKAPLIWDNLDSTDPTKLYLNYAATALDSTLDSTSIDFAKSNFIFSPMKKNPEHPNSLILQAFDISDKLLLQQEWLSTGGGAIRLYSQKTDLPDVKFESDNSEPIQSYNEETDSNDSTFGFSNAEELLQICNDKELQIFEVAEIIEKTNYDQDSINSGLDEIWKVMKDCIQTGLNVDLKLHPILPGGLEVARRAPKLWTKIKNSGDAAFHNPRSATQVLSCYTLAVNEQNAAGGRIVAAPTTGSAGIIPAVLQYWLNTNTINSEENAQRIREFLLTAAAIGSIIKANGSISGAEAGCQAEIGSACSMAAAGYTYLIGGTPEQSENAAEIALEYHLGLTCDPVAGLVQIPCIERNAIASNTAITASNLAMSGDGSHRVSLDTAIETMRKTGLDMSEKYKETSQAGLASTFVAC